MNAALKNCPLCACKKTDIFYQDTRSDFIYYQCHQCQLIFLDPKFHLQADEEKKIYDHHQNDQWNEGYKNFLMTLISPLLKYLRPDQRKIALDYGSGPSSYTAALLKENEFERVDLYDPYYYPQYNFLPNSYDVIICSETAEHFYFPGVDFKRLYGLLTKEGLLGIMTLRFDESMDFASWYYRQDHTHVCFYHQKTFEWLARTFNMDLDLIGDRVALLRKRIR